VLRLCCFLTGHESCDAWRIPGKVAASGSKGGTQDLLSQHCAQSGAFGHRRDEHQLRAAAAHVLKCGCSNPQHFVGIGGTELDRDDDTLSVPNPIQGLDHWENTLGLLQRWTLRKTQVLRKEPERGKDGYDQQYRNSDADNACYRGTRRLILGNRAFRAARALE
jgi:hypothetical protein